MRTVGDTPDRAFGSKYLIGEVVGRGAMGTVFRGRVRDSDIPVAIKVLREDLSHNAEVITRFVQERQMLRQISHTNVVKVHDLVVEDDSLGIVMDYLSEGSLNNSIERQLVSPRSATIIAADLADGLAAIHQAGIAHRDVKPANVLVKRVGGEISPLITDFGVSRLVGNTATALSQVIGTPSYMAPECSVRKPSDPAERDRQAEASDVYALGVTLFEMLTSRRPFTDQETVAQIMAHRERPVPRISGIPSPLMELVEEMMAKDWRSRVVNPADLAVRLRSIAPTTPTESSSVQVVPPSETIAAALIVAQAPEETSAAPNDPTPASTPDPTAMASNDPPLATPLGVASAPSTGADLDKARSKSPTLKWIAAGLAAVALVIAGILGALQLTSDPDMQETAATEAKDDDEDESPLDDGDSALDEEATDDQTVAGATANSVATGSTDSDSSASGGNRIEVPETAVPSNPTPTTTRQTTPRQTTPKQTTAKQTTASPTITQPTTEPTAEPIQPTQGTAATQGTPALQKTLTLSQGAPRGPAFWYNVSLSGFPPGVSVSVTCHVTGHSSYLTQTYTTSSSGTVSNVTPCYSDYGPDHWVTSEGLTSNVVKWD